MSMIYSPGMRRPGYWLSIAYVVKEHVDALTKPSKDSEHPRSSPPKSVVYGRLARFFECVLHETCREMNIPTPTATHRIEEMEALSDYGIASDVLKAVLSLNSPHRIRGGGWIAPDYMLTTAYAYLNLLTALSQGQDVLDRWPETLADFTTFLDELIRIGKEDDEAEVARRMMGSDDE